MGLHIQLAFTFIISGYKYHLLKTGDKLAFYKGAKIMPYFVNYLLMT